ncbi:MAG: chromosome segregation protein SMC [Lachnospiraceae bacterium]|nr:chromosome segregation protein SMC [Lachnospiraceae bacterium]
MYLKSIEVHGFKSFANKIVLDFHNGITGIVGPNGSGKSNVSDAVRWVLGEQSAKQLRGASMQDVIFAGTENRKPLSYAYVAITMDNSDRCLDIDFEEVTVARRVYRSGESEYLINGSPCRLKDVQELFYDTGIGKEGYSIIGQGQIEKILSGRPEERRELFDEAAGIVKYKRRKVTAQKKLDAERENLIRVKDILSELERQVGPLEKQSEKAKIYLKKKEELKAYDVNMFLLEVERIDTQVKEVDENHRIAEGDLADTKASFEKIREEYDRMEAVLEQMDMEIAQTKDNISNSTLLKGKLEGQINVLNEQIKAAEMSDEHFRSRVEELEKEREEKTKQKEAYEQEKAKLDRQLEDICVRRKKAEAELLNLQESVRKCNAGIEGGKAEQMELLQHKASLQANLQKYDTLIEQTNIRKAQLNQRLLQGKSAETDLYAQLQEQEEILAAIEADISDLKQQEEELLQQQGSWKKKLLELSRVYEEDTTYYHKASSRLESLRNIAERYDGYGNSIRKVMEQKEQEKGLLGVVSDLIKVEKKYETAIETALGGSIQNIVTEDEQTAKRMISYLKQNRLGRATFLPLTSVDGKAGIKNPEALKEQGVIGLANTLVQNDTKYNGITSYLLGRVVVVDTIDHAIALAKKYRYSLSIVTLEGESLRPGGSMTGGAFKNNSNLLGRNREIEDLTEELQALRQKLEEHKNRREEILTAQALIDDDMEEVKGKLQEQYIKQNTAKLNVESARQKKDESDNLFRGLQIESAEIDREIRDVKAEKEQALQEIEAAKKREEEITEETSRYQEILDEQMYLESSVNKTVSEVQIEEANICQKSEFATTNIARVQSEIEKCDLQVEELQIEVATAKEDAEKKKQDIEEIKQTILASDTEYSRLEGKLQEMLAKKEQMSVEHKSFFAKREEISNRMGELDKEIFRLNSQKEKLDEARERQTNYMWEEYELTLHSAMELRNEAYENLSELKKQIAQIKEDIRNLGDVNVNAIDEYKTVSERYQFLKTQHDDLVEAEATLVQLIEELDIGMRKQFTEKFAEIQREFDKAFKELFGGGKGTLELVEDEDILESGIRIIAQPPGKKLQNMILLSGGEKSLTAIALLFAIQNLKPSPFCLLDEIEAALDDSNVGRFAGYLHKLTKNTQFIVITHRRGTMAAADRLYGITMQEKGVSTMVSVNLIEHDLDK